jgi:HEAT repeat protein
MIVGVVIRTLQDTNEYVRGNALRILRKTHANDTRLAEWLLPLLTDKNTSVRGQALDALFTLGAINFDDITTMARDADVTQRVAVMIALMNNDDPRAVDILLSALHDPETTVRRNAAHALEYVKDIRALDPLLHALADADTRVRKSVERALGSLGQPAIIALHQMTASAVPEERKRAETTLVSLHAQLPIDLLIRLLQSEQVKSRRYAVWRLYAYHDARAIPALITALHDVDEGIQKTAASALAAFDDPASLQALLEYFLIIPEHGWQSGIEFTRYDGLDPAIRAFQRTQDAGIYSRLMKDAQAGPIKRRARALYALSVFHQTREETLIAALKDRHAFLRQAAAYGLRERKEVSAVEPLIAAFADRDAEVRCAILGALDAIGDMRAASVFIRALNDNDEGVRAASYYSYMIMQPAAVPELTKALRRQDAEIQFRVIDSLERVGDARAVPALLQALKGERDLRPSIIRALGDIGDTRAIPSLISCLRDTDADVRRSAVFALAVFNTEEALEALLRELQYGDFTLQYTIVEALSTYDDQRVVAAFEQLLYHPSISERRINDQIFEALQQMGDLGIDAIIRACSDANPSVRRAAIYGLDGVCDPRAVAIIRSALRDPDKEVRIAAAWSQYPVGNPELSDDFIKALDDENESVRTGAAFALAGLGEARAKPLLYQAFNDPKAGEIDAAVVLAGKLKDSEAVEPLLEVIRGYNPDAQEFLPRILLEALGHIGDPRAVEPILGLLKSRLLSSAPHAYDIYDFCVSDLISTVGQLKDERAVPFLIQSIVRETEWTDELICALGAIGSPKAIAYLQQAAVDERYTLRCIGALGLGAWGDLQALPALQNAAQDTHWRVREAAARGLGNISDAQAVTLLLTLLEDVQPEVRESAVFALGYQQDPRVLPRLIGMLSDPYVDVREATVKALQEHTGNCRLQYPRQWLAWWAARE